MSADSPLEFDPTELSPVNPEPEAPKSTLAGEDLVLRLITYLHEGENARMAGHHPRKEIWRENLQAYWMERDYSDKMEWQSKEKTPAVPNFVKRFGAAHRRALLHMKDWFKVTDRSEPSDELGKLATKITRKTLDYSGRNATGQPVAFEKSFGDAITAGALMAACVSVTWKRGLPAIELVDPRDVILDPTARGLYRIRRMEMDWHDIIKMGEEMDSAGNPLWDMEAILSEQPNTDEEQRQNKRDSSGAGQETSSERKPMVIHEFLSVNLDRDGKADANGAKMLTVLLNQKTIIRGPEPNPFWHQKDWIVFHPLISAPLASVDGETYVETFVDTARTFENMTNVLIDAVRMSSMNAFEYNPEKLENPDDLRNGIGPNQAFALDSDYVDGKPVIRPIELGKPLGPEPFNLWRGIKDELREAAGQSELSLGQVPQKGDVTATAATLSNEGQNALIESVAADIETNFLNPILYLAFYTTIQHLDADSDPEFLSQFTPQEISMIAAKRDEFRNRIFTFSARGISALLERAERLRGLLGAVNIVGSNPLLVDAFQKAGYSLGKLVKTLLEEFGVDLEKIKMTPDEQVAAATPPPGLPVGEVTPGEGLSNKNSAGGVDPAAQGLGIDKRI